MVMLLPKERPEQQAWYIAKGGQQIGSAALSHPIRATRVIFG